MNWQTFPLNYREKEMKMLVEWISRGASCSVVGLAGCGRSNLLDFLCHRTDALQTYLPANTAPIVLIPIDLNTLPSNDLATFYRVMLRSFYWIRHHVDHDLQETITTLYLENRAVSDPFLSQSAVHELLFAFQKKQTQVVLVINRFDLFYQDAPPRLVNTLRGVRDSFKNLLGFIVGMEQEVAFLPNRDSFGDMYSLLDKNVCWVGAMGETDARQVMAKEVRHAPNLPTEDELKEILTLAGNFPVLLKDISNWWLNITPKPPQHKWLEILMKDESFEHRLARMWHGLTQEEQFVLASVLAPKQTSKNGAVSPTKLVDEHLTTLNRLVDKGLCYQTEQGWQIMGTLMADYIKRFGSSSGRGRIRLDDKTEDIYQGTTVLRSLSPLEGKLLRFLLKHPYKRHTYTHLIDEVWASDQRDDHGKKFVDRERTDLQMLTAGLRKKIEVNSAESRYIVNWRGNPEGGYQLYPEGRPEQVVENS